ncbi:hypothetical protein PtA15_17A375 [Puccinia triticina]|uniref:Secreted protein n=1 Tax=Puccinia triticina TaxID=208348 RepID=A0ABY7D8I3_9BASI|nr:uncharacterized protein PtA15_17A375 [Puccinia triticina]WAQ92893.1 hypothetical protein PtA15_17A375 [Puccinia triticina]
MSIGWSLLVLMASLDEGRAVRAWLPSSIFICSSNISSAGLKEAAGSSPLAGSILSLSSGTLLQLPLHPIAQLCFIHPSRLSTSKKNKSIHMARYGQLLAADKGFGIPTELYYGTGTCPGYAI